MIAHARAVVGPGGVLRSVHSEPPLTLRQVRAERPTTCALRLVGSAAGPLAGDDLRLDLEVLAAATATLGATGASIAQGRPGQRPGRVRSSLCIADGAALSGDTGALVVSAGSAVQVDVDLTIAPDAHVDWQELIVLGRSGEPGGAAVLRWNAVLGGRPLLRQTLDLRAGDTALTGGHRVVASALLVSPRLAARTVVLGPGAVAARLAEHAVLLTVLADDAARAVDDLAALRAALDIPAA